MLEKCIFQACLVDSSHLGYYKMHEEEEEDSSVGTLGEKKPSLLPAIGGTIFLVGGTLVFSQEIPTYQLIQGMHKLSSHIVSRPMHNQG